jgi:catechol 2,3-dioxygenase-like lactoylglutathione lyase family enzyme
VKVNRISAVTLFVKDMDRSCKFYSAIPGFTLVCGGKSSSFTTLEIKKGSKTYLNLELRKEASNKDFGRIIFYTSDVDELYRTLRKDNTISKLGLFENKPTNAPWGERFFHIRDPDGYQLSFAMPIKNTAHVT